MFIKQFWKDVSISASKLSDHLVLGFIIAFIDAFSIALISFLYSFFSRRIMQSTIKALADGMETLEKVTPEVITELTTSSLGQNTIFYESIKNGSLFLLIVYLTWSIIQTFSWHITYRITERKEGPKLVNYIKRFFLTNLLWFLPIYLLMFTYFHISTRTSLMQNSGYYLYIFYAILGIIAIGMHISYCIIFQKKKLNEYISDYLRILKLKKMSQVLVIFLCAGILYYLADIIQLALIHSPGAMLFVGFILVFFIVIMTRLMLLKTINRVLNKNEK